MQGNRGWQKGNFQSVAQFNPSLQRPTEGQIADKILLTRKEGLIADKILLTSKVNRIASCLAALARSTSCSLFTLPASAARAYHFTCRPSPAHMPLTLFAVFSHPRCHFFTALASFSFFQIHRLKVSEANKRETFSGFTRGW